MIPPAGPISSFDVLCALLSIADAEPASVEYPQQVLGDHYANIGLDEGLAHDTEYHGVTPLIAPFIISRSHDSGDVRCKDVFRVFNVLARRHQRACQMREDCIDKLLAAFAGAGLPMLLLKGAALAHILYSKPHLRASIDIDILVDPTDEQKVTEIVRDLGFSFPFGQVSSIANNHHHLPVATKMMSGFTIALDVHREAISRDQPYRLTLRTLTQQPQVIRRGLRPSALAFGHVDMLHHLTRHAFEPAGRIRLIHLYDIWRYLARFRDEIDLASLKKSHPHVVVSLQLVEEMFSRRDSSTCHSRARPAGVGTGMLPLAQIAGANIGLMMKVKSLFDPPAWWLHGYYGVPLGGSLLTCRVVRHPATVMRWLGRRLVARATERGRREPAGNAAKARRAS